MGVMKRAYEHRLYGGYTTVGWKVAFGLAPPPPTTEEKADARIAARELKAEREAIRAVEREQEEERRREEEAARPRVFAPPPPDFPRTGRPGPAAAPVPVAVAPTAPEIPPEMIGLACKLPWAAQAHRDQGRDLARFLATGGDPEMRGRYGPPEPPQRDTGWYRWGDSFCRVGSGPFPEYRPPGLTWKLRWTDPKPDDVPWEDEDVAGEVEPPPAATVAAGPEPPRAAGGRLSQGSLF